MPDPNQATKTSVKSHVAVNISVAVMMFGAVVAAGGFLAPLIFGPIVPEDPAEPVLSGPGDEFRCVDDDGRRNFRTKGTVTHYYEDGSESSATDNCSSGNVAVDYYCPGAGVEVIVKGVAVDEQGEVVEDEQAEMVPKFMHDRVICHITYGQNWNCSDGACVYTPWCGDSICNGDEECDLCIEDCGNCVCGDGKCEGYETCETCVQDCGECVVCGDGNQAGGEDCDGVDLGGETCFTLLGITDNDLTCNADCTFNTTECFFCGDAKARGVEGDVNNDDAVDAADLVYLIDYIYNNGPAPCFPPEDYKAPAGITTKQEVLAYLYESQSSSISGMPPHSDLLEKVKQGIAELPDFMTDVSLRMQSGINTPAPKLNLKALPKSRSGGPSEFKTLAVLIEFTDKPNIFGETYFDDLLYSKVSGDSSMRNYYFDNSYGQLDIITLTLPSAVKGSGGVTGWQTAPETYTYYTKGIGCTQYPECSWNYLYGFGCWPCNSQKLAKDIVLYINSHDPSINFADYDNDGDGYMDELILIHAGSGAEYGSPNDMWSHKWAIPDEFCKYNSSMDCDNDADCVVGETDYGSCIKNNRPVLDGVTIRGYTVQAERRNSSNPAQVGTFVHETGHMLGLPDLYDLDHSSNGIGYWSLMSDGAWLGTFGSSPANLDAWSKVQLGFVDPINLVVHQEFPACVNLPSGGDSPNSVLRLWTNNELTSDEYFLIENRQKTGWDSYLPGAGLSIWHIDDNKPNNTQEWWPGQPWQEHYRVALEQADNLYEMEHGSCKGDASDLFPGSLNKYTFNLSSNPGSKSYAGGGTEVSVTNISASQQTMTADISVSSSKSTAPPATCGDMNYDGKVGYDDFKYLLDYIFGS